MLYLDSSALVKLVVTESETTALRGYLDEHADQTVVTSALARVEVVRSVRQVDPTLVGSAWTLLGRADQIPVSPDLLTEAADLLPDRLRGLDAIHLATALRVRKVGLSAMVAYDHRLLEAAESAGLPTATP